MTEKVYLEQVLYKTLILITSLFCLINLQAQDKNRVKIGVETGILDLSEKKSLGLLLQVEPKLKASKNAFIGLKIGVTLNSQSIENTERSNFYIDEDADNGTISFVPTIDYYWKVNDYRPYLGLGIGVHLFGNPIEVYQFKDTDPPKGIIELSINNQLGFLFRGGVEFNKTRLGLEYNFIPKADIEMPDGQSIGKVDISYLGLSIGFVIGVVKGSR